MNPEIHKALASQFNLKRTTIEAIVDCQTKLVIKAMEDGKTKDIYKKVRCPHLGTFFAKEERIAYIQSKRDGTVH